MKGISKLVMAINLFSVAGLLSLGCWWLYLLIRLSTHPEMAINTDFVNLAKWEGGTFIIFLTILTASFYRLFYKDYRKTKSLQAFFSSLTHELKTPLASIRLQAEVLADSISSRDVNDTNLKFAERLIDDTQNLETQMDKIIQLSRVERDGPYNLNTVNLTALLQKVILDYGSSLDIQLLGETHQEIIGDNFAIELILKNLIENTTHHSDHSSVKITVKRSEQYINVNYCDQGKFTGDIRKLGKLFYTHHSTRGSGIGLYLINKLMKKMNGELSINTTPSFNVDLLFSTNKELS